MTEVLLCLVCIVMVLWLLLLMAENRKLKAETAKLRRQLRDHLGSAFGHLEIRPGRKLTASEVNQVDKPACR